MSQILQSLYKTLLAGLVLLILVIWIASTVSGQPIQFGHAWGTFVMRWLHVVTGIMWIGPLQQPGAHKSAWAAEFHPVHACMHPMIPGPPGAAAAVPHDCQHACWCASHAVKNQFQFGLRCHLRRGLLHAAAQRP